MRVNKKDRLSHNLRLQIEPSQYGSQEVVANIAANSILANVRIVCALNVGAAVERLRLPAVAKRAQEQWSVTAEPLRADPTACEASQTWVRSVELEDGEPCH